MITLHSIGLPGTLGEIARPRPRYNSEPLTAVLLQRGLQGLNLSARLVIGSGLAWYIVLGCTLLHACASAACAGVLTLMPRSPSLLPCIREPGALGADRHSTHRADRTTGPFADFLEGGFAVVC